MENARFVGKKKEKRGSLSPREKETSLGDE